MGSLTNLSVNACVAPGTEEPRAQRGCQSIKNNNKHIVDIISKYAEQKEQASDRAGTFPSAPQRRSSAKLTHFILLTVRGGRSVQEYAIQEQVSA